MARRSGFRCGQRTWMCRKDSRFVEDLEIAARPVTDTHRFEMVAARRDRRQEWIGAFSKSELAAEGPTVIGAEPRQSRWPERSTLDIAAVVRAPGAARTTVGSPNGTPSDRAIRSKSIAGTLSMRIQIVATGHPGGPSASTGGTLDEATRTPGPGQPPCHRPGAARPPWQRPPVRNALLNDIPVRGHARERRSVHRDARHHAGHAVTARRCCSTGR